MARAKGMCGRGRRGHHLPQLGRATRPCDVSFHHCITPLGAPRSHLLQWSPSFRNSGRSNSSTRPSSWSTSPPGGPSQQTCSPQMGVAQAHLTHRSPRALILPHTLNCLYSALSTLTKMVFLTYFLVEFCTAV